MAITISTPTLYTLTGNKNEILVTTSTTGVTAHFLHLKIDVFKSDGVTTIDSFTDKLPVIAGKATFEIQEFLRQKQTENFTELIVNSKEHDLVVSYTLSAFETYDYSNTEQNTIIDPTLYYAVQGKIESDYELRLETLASTFYADWLQANKFLTNKPRNLNQLTNERLKLYYLALATESVDLVCDIVFADASTSSITIETISMTENKIYELLVGFTELKLAAQETTSKIVSYKIYLQATSWTSEVFEITIERDYYPNKHQFIFKNAFGVYDTILLRGIEGNNKSYENVFGSINDKQLAVSKIATNNFSTASGILSYSTKSWIWEFSNSLDAYSIVGDIIYSIIIKNESDVSIVDNSFLYGHLVKYEQIKAVKQIVEYVPKIVIEFKTTTANEQVSYLISANKNSIIDIIYSDNTTDSYIGQGSVYNTTKTKTFATAGTHYAYLTAQNTDLEVLNPVTDNIIGFDFNNIANNGQRGLIIDANGKTNFAYCSSMAGNIYSQNYSNTAISEINNINCNQVFAEGYSLLKAENAISLSTVKLGNGEFNTNSTGSGLQLSGCTNLTNLNLGNAIFNPAPLNLSNCSSLIEIITSNNNNIYIYFKLYDCINLKTIQFRGNEIIHYATAIWNGFYNTVNSAANSLIIDKNIIAQNFDFKHTNFTTIDLTKLKLEWYSGEYEILEISYNDILTEVLNVNGSVWKLYIRINQLLTNITFNNLTIRDNCYIYIDRNALQQTNIDYILQYIVDSLAINGVLMLHGGTNAAPSTSGEANIDILRSRGWTVTVTGGY